MKYYISIIGRGKSLLQLALFSIFSFLVISCNEIPPPTPTNLTATDEFGLRVDLTWTGSTDAVYTIYRADGDGETPTDSEFVEIATSDSTTYSDLDVVSSSSYYYRLKASNSAGSSDLSETVLGSTVYISAEESFQTIAKYTGGKRYDVSYAEEIPDAIIEIIEKHGTANVDLVFLIDNTGSMDNDISEVKSSLNDIIAMLDPNTRLSIATYNDANEDPSNWYHCMQFTTDYTLATDFLNNIDVYGGGDFPESVYDGLYETMTQLTWSSSKKRMIIVIGDAPPLEGAYSSHSLSEIVKMCTEGGIDVNLYPILIGGDYYGSSPEKSNQQ